MSSAMGFIEGDKTLFVNFPTSRLTEPSLRRVGRALNMVIVGIPTPVKGITIKLKKPNEESLTKLLRVLKTDGNK